LAREKKSLATPAIGSIELLMDFNKYILFEIVSDGKVLGSCRFLLLPQMPLK